MALTPKRMHLKFNAAGNLVGRPYWGVEVEISKDGKQWTMVMIVDDEIFEIKSVTRKALLTAIYDTGADEVMTCNILNPDAGEFPIARASKGGCCDPATETYHSM